MPDLTEILCEHPELLDDPVARGAFVAAVNQVVPELRLNTQLQWQLLWRGAAQHTQIAARRFVGVDNQALLPLRDWLMERLGSRHALFADVELAESLTVLPALAH